MQRSNPPAIQVKNHPFRFLLYLEWGLLAIAIFSASESPQGRELKRQVQHGIVHSPWLTVLCIVLFGLMGLYLPRRPIPRLGHTIGQVLLIIATLSASTRVFNDGRIFPFIYLVLVIRSCLMFGLGGRIAIASLSFILFVTGLQLRLRSLSKLGTPLPPRARRQLGGIIFGLQINFVVLFGLCLLLVVLLINALLTERKSQEQLQQANQELRRSAQKVEKLAMEQERSRIARDIHDSLGHSLTALNIQLESGLKTWQKDPYRAEQFLKEAKRLGSQSLADVRQSVAALRNDALAGRSLPTAINQLVDDIQNHQNALKIHQDIHLQHPLPANTRTILYRIAQESLTNIVKHAEAQQVRLQISETQTSVILTIEDNGKGFDPKLALSGFGLQSMRDRAESASGTFAIKSSNNAQTQSPGTRIQVSLPIAKYRLEEA